MDVNYERNRLNDVRSAKRAGVYVCVYVCVCMRVCACVRAVTDLKDR